MNERTRSNLLAAICIGLALIGISVWVNGSRAADPAGTAGHGRYTIVMQDRTSSGSVLDTETGQVWLLREDVRLAVRDYVPQGQR